MVLKNVKIKLLISVILLLAAFGAAFPDDAADIAGAVKKEIIRRNPAYSDARIEIEFKDPDSAFSGLADLKGKKTYRIDLQENRRLSGSMIVPVSVYENGHPRGRIDLRSSIVIFKDVLVSSARIGKGAQLTSKDIRYSEKNVSVLPSSVLFDKEGVIGKESLTFIPEGTVLLDWMFRQVPTVRKGGTVELFKTVSGISVSAKALALEDSYLGKNVRVKNLSSGKTVDGIVRSSWEVEAL